MTTELDNDTLEWAAEWIEGSLKGEASERVREFARNMATTLRAAKTPRVSAEVAPPNHALVQLLNAALLYPESAEGNIRQVVESLSTSAPIVAPVVDGPSSARGVAEEIGRGVAFYDFQEFTAHLANWTHGYDKNAALRAERAIVAIISKHFAPASTVAPVEQSERSNHFSNAAIDKGMFPDHISSDGTAYYADGTVLRPAPASPAAIRDEAERPRAVFDAGFATTPPSTLAKAAAEIARFVDRVQPLPFATGLLEKDIAAIIERCLSTEREDQPKGSN